MARSRRAKRKETQKRRLADQATDRARTLEQKSPIRALVALAATILVVAGVLIVTGTVDVASSSGSRSSVGVEREVSILLNGIPQSGVTLGQPSAPITLQIIGDLESADVRTFVVWLLPDIIHDWVRTDVVKVEYLSLMTASLPYPNVFVSQQAAASAAGMQDRLWNYIETFYREQGKEHTRYVTDAFLGNIARQVPGLELAEWENDRENAQLTRRVEEEDHAIRTAGLADTPAFLIGRTGRRLTLWSGYRLYEQPGRKKGFTRRPTHPVSFITSRTLKVAIEHLS